MAVFRYRQDAEFLKGVLSGLTEQCKDRGALHKELRNVMFPYLEGQKEDFADRVQDIMDRTMQQGPITIKLAPEARKGIMDVINSRR